jgi:hypothetical protein
VGGMKRESPEKKKVIDLMIVPRFIVDSLAFSCHACVWSCLFRRYFVFASFLIETQTNPSFLYFFYHSSYLFDL